LANLTVYISFYFLLRKSGQAVVDPSDLEYFRVSSAYVNRRFTQFLDDRRWSNCPRSSIYFCFLLFRQRTSNCDTPASFLFQFRNYTHCANELEMLVFSA
jgi:hypothetical protein